VYLAYYDEAGDDGYPKFSSKIFVLSACYLHYLNWKDVNSTLASFRRHLKDEFGLPVNVEFHCKQFLLNKDPFRDYEFTGKNRVAIIQAFCEMVAQLSVRFVNVAIIKPRILKQDYNVLDWALKMSIQRIENDLEPSTHPENRFLIITDTGRVGKMRRTTRRIQRFNYIPSKFGASAYRKEIQSLIEDPLPKDSKESYLIQICDMVSYIVYLHCLTQTKSGSFSNRMPGEVTKSVVSGWLDAMMPCLNTKASEVTPYGIVVHPAKQKERPVRAAL
jgi:hypothetical protein